MPHFFAMKHSPFSNFHTCKFTDPSFPGVTFTSSEQNFMARKAREFHDEATLALILNTDNPAEAKRLGRKVQNYDEKQWGAVRFQHMQEALRLKFTQDERCQKALLETGNQEMVEASPWDGLWGIGMDEKTAKQTPREHWGKNLLGLALEGIRAEIRKTQKT